jgi:hypothetical protein
MSDTNPLSIQEDQNTLYYHFSPAALVSNFTPLLIIIDEEDPSLPTHFEYKMWNILTPVEPIDSSLLQMLIRTLSEEYESEDHIYFYSRGSRTYFTIHEAIKAQANALFIKEPFKGESNTLLDLEEQLQNDEIKPILYFCDKHPSKELQALTKVCDRLSLPYQVDDCFESDEPKEEITKVLSFLEKMVSQI